VQGAVGAVERALVELEGVGYPFERGRALLALGTIRRQAQQKGPARAALEQAVTIFEGLAPGCGRPRPGASWPGSAVAARQPSS
jgi:hypothetical protein